MLTAFVYPSGKLAKLTEEEFTRRFPCLRRVIVQPIPQEPAMHKLFYFNTNEIPVGGVTSTARLGREWYDQVEVGDTVAVHRVEGKEFVGYSVVVAKEFLSYQDVWENADHNSVGYGKPIDLARQELNRTMQRAFGEALRTIEMVAPHFSVLHLLPINNADDIPNDIAIDLIENAVADAVAVVQKAEAHVKNLSGALASQGEQLLEAHRARRDVEKTNELLLGIISQKVAEEEAKKKDEYVELKHVVDSVAAMAIGHTVAARDGGPFVRAAERIDVIGDLTSTVRVEF